MKKISLYILALAAICLSSCVSLDDAIVSSNYNGKKLEIMASASDFSNINVGTKALEDRESEVKELTMFVFDSDNQIVGKPINLNGENSVFMIDTQGAVLIDGNNTQIPMTNAQTKLDTCTIYMVANCWHILSSDPYKDKINDLATLLEVDIPVSGIDITSYAMPMMGFEPGFDLSKDRDEDAATVADIKMDKLFAKINVRFQINADQSFPHTPSFSLTEWSVNNIPSKLRLGIPTALSETPHANAEAMLTVNGGTVLSEGKTTITHSESVANPDFFQITFYAPEHRVNPDPTVMNNFKESLRTGGGNIDNAVPESDWQKYKPKFCAESQKPMYVTVNGAFTDHQGQVSNVTYSLYLGQNNTDDFYINRNQQLNNYITIKGLTNNKSAADPENPYNVSVDHRVDVEESGYSIAIERETLLDSHFEFRPMDVTVSAGAKVVITVNSDDDETTDDDWLRIEKSYGGDDRNNSATNSTYIHNVGIRKYFTKDLITSTLKNSRSITIQADDNPLKSRIWLYFDENENVYDKTVNDSQMYRYISVTVDYFAKGNNTNVPTSSNNFTFRQMSLWRLWTYTNDGTKNRFYDIEYHEEYLYNYASDENYGKRKDGMVWGLDGIQFSGRMRDDMKTEAVVITTTGWSSGIISSIIQNTSPYYDFYLPREAADISPDLKVPNNQYAGRRFTNAIIEADVDQTGSYSAIDLIQRELNDDPVSAIEYCLNKNRRNKLTGRVDKTDRGWYLPAIDEIEEIMVAGYTDFEVFQNKMYWSCQTAFHKNHFLYSSTILSDSDFKGDYYRENTNSARATSALYLGVDSDGKDIYTYAGSGVINDGYYESMEISVFSGGSDAQAVIIPADGKVIRYWDGSYDFIFQHYIDILLNQVKYDVGYNSRGQKINRVRCVRNSGTAADI